MAVHTDRRATVLAVEDDPDLGPMVRDVLAEAYDVTLAKTGDAGLEAALNGDFDAFVVDRRLPGIDGVEIVRRLRAAGIATPILLLTALATVGDRVEGLDAGANDYLVKPFDFDELHARLRALLRVFPAEGPSIMIGAWEFHPRSRSIDSPYTGRVALTPREAALLELLATDPSRAFSRGRILRQVFDTGEHSGTVDTYVHTIRRKTERNLIETARGVGYRLGSP